MAEEMTVRFRPPTALRVALLYGRQPWKCRRPTASMWFARNCPGITALALVCLIAGWALVTGALEIVAAIRLREYITHEWLLTLSGVASLLFGILAILLPLAGAVAIALGIGVYALVFGVLLIGLGFRLRSWTRTPHAGESFPQPAG
jgi:uncharacterized membrane protein HdeD (DUF308 family)